MLLAPYVCFHIFSSVKVTEWPPIGKIAAHSAYEMFSWYKYLIVGLVFSRLGFWSGNLFLTAPFPDLCLLVPSYNDPRGGAIFGPRGKIGRIYVELHMTMLYIKYTSFVSCCCREDFFIYFHYKSMVDNDMPGAWPVWTPGEPLAAFIKERIIHWSTQHMKALGHMVSEKKMFFMFFP